MNDIKKCIVPGLLALVGVRLGGIVAATVAPKSQAADLVISAAGGIAGCFLALKL